MPRQPDPPDEGPGARRAPDETPAPREPRGASGFRDPRVGLCGECSHVRIQVTRRGSRFYRCGREEEDPRYLRYPPLPVTRCEGFAPEPL